LATPAIAPAGRGHPRSSGRLASRYRPLVRLPPAFRHYVGYPPDPRINSAYALTPPAKTNRASVAERLVALPPGYRKGGRHMPNSQFLYLRENLREIVRSAVETQHESADILLLARNLRARAEEALALAENLYTPRTRQTMLGVAATYEKLAQWLERHAGNPDQ
jgi:hypothetical protein